ncbi:ComEA family DNA-binding protein [uncultured Methylobacterium sp.]|uniref:ComEA family DNA-binding protein n=1 Tax=uncultured Methylobacterium sp. TaxID=157278 RepID=UPI0035CB59A6
MLSGSAILRVSVLLIVAGCLAALIQYLLPRPAPGPEMPVPIPATATVAPAPRRIETLPAPQRSPVADSVADSVAGPMAGPMASPATPQAPEAGREVPAPVPPRAPPANPQPAPVAFTPPQLAQPPEKAAAAAANDTAGPRAMALVDLNTASVAELNGLRGGGSIGRAIVQRRPYDAVDQLLSKRVLSRATYDRIKDQVTAR